jgi:hypothetical protein
LPNPGTISAFAGVTEDNPRSSRNSNQAPFEHECTALPSGLIPLGIKDAEEGDHDTRRDCSDMQTAFLVVTPCSLVILSEDVGAVCSYEELYWGRTQDSTVRTLLNIRVYCVTADNTFASIYNVNIAKHRQWIPGNTVD